ncbi:MAG: transcription termination/antitermination protein NusA [Clostridia bacterium]|nr:transcription termination/antitermination protein NusA [Clostridia bacterium]MBQ8339224.1 transcription termination/antitermination protein NusA [Clostridia bacterium]
MSTKKSSKESFVNALELLEKEKGIPKAYMIEKIEAALVSAYHKEYGSGANVRIVFDLEKDDVKVFQQKTVVEEVVDPENEITLADAKAISRRYTLGQLIEIKVKPENFRRLSAAAAKSVIIQSIREGERKVMQDAYENQREEIITATVNKIDLQTGNVVLDTGTGRAVLLKSEQIPGEEFAVDDRVKVFVMEVSKEAHGPLVTLSRSHAGLVRRLFELEVPEIADGVVMIKSVSREAGVRSKVAVYTRDPDVDPVGACIGNRGLRIASIVDELRGEKVDIVTYSESIEEFIANALAPARVISVEMTGERSCRVLVDPDQLSLAIGREGLNARLAARLTGCKIDIKAE